MSLHKIKDFDPDYKDHFDEDIIGLDLYSGNEKVGSVENILVDEKGSFRYFVIHTGSWIFGKQTLLPVGRSRIDTNARRVYADGLSKTQVESLPQYDENSAVDYEREEQTRKAYRAPVTASAAPAPVMAAKTSPGATATPDTYDYNQDADLYDLSHNERQTLKLYEERLIAGKTRQKAGEVSIGKHVETETAKVSVPIEKERVVIERTPGNAKSVAPDEATFQAGEVARMEVYAETPDIRKEAFVREEVSIHKEVDHETVEAQEQIRREQLDINKESSAVVDKGMDSPPVKRSN